MDDNITLTIAVQGALGHVYRLKQIFKALLRLFFSKDDRIVYELKRLKFSGMILYVTNDW